MRPWQTATSVTGITLAGLLVFAAGSNLLSQDAKPAVAKDVAYADGGDQQMLDLYLPRKKGFTTVVFTFGGGWHTGGRKSVTAIGQKLQSLGYGCALVSHRLAPQHKFPAQAEDVAAAFAWVHKNIAARGGDPRRVVLMGHSSGAHLSLLIATDPQYLAQHRLAAADIAGVVGLSTPVDLEPHADRKGFGDVLLAGKGAVVFARDAAVMKSASPIQHVSRHLPPTLLVVGEKDFPMLEGDARRFAEKARDVGRPVTTFVSKGRDHMGVVRSLLEDRSDIREQVLAFIAGPAPAAAGEPEPIHAIDAHTHFYDPARPQGVPWPSKTDKLLYRTVLPPEFKALTKKHGIASTIVVEASPRLEDNQWLLDLAAKDPFIVAVVGNLDISSDDFPKNLKRFAANPRFRGIRISHADVRKALDQPRLRDHLRLLAKHDRVLDVNGGPDLPADVARLARLLPGLRIVINHAANLPIDGKAVPEKWLTGMRAAAAEKNVYCKVSALVEATGRRKGDAPADPAYYRPVLDALWTTFGEDRLIYGSNWPVSDNAAPYATVYRIVDEYFRPRGKPAAAKFFRQNAVAAYKLPRLTPAERRRLPKESPRGRRQKLSLGTLFIPDGLNTRRPVPLFIHFHAPAWIPEVAARRHASAVISVALGQGSAVYARPFADPDAFHRLLNEAEQHAGVRFSTVGLTAWSAGYGAVRAILKDTTAYERVDFVVLIDGMHASYTGGPQKSVLPEHVEVFARFAADAALGKKRMIVTHSEIVPGNYASTTETADYLLRRLALKRTTAPTIGPMGLRQLSAVKKGCFRLVGYAGKEASDHIDQLHALPELLTWVAAPHP